MSSRGSHHHAGEQIVVAAQVLGGAVDDQVCAQGDRVLVDGRGEGIVDNHDRASCLARGGQLRQVDDPQEWVGGSFHVDQVAAGPNSLQQAILIQRVAHHTLDAKPGQNLGEMKIGRPIRIADAHCPVPRAKERHQGGVDGGHAGGETQAGLRSLQRRHLGLEMPFGRVGIATVGVSRALMDGHLPPALQIRKGEGGVLDDGRQDRTGRRVERSGVMDAAGGGSSLAWPYASPSESFCPQG